ncbi:hypothetical protein QE152_g40254 [Popillia japonica]|uniref:Uncharacterized protein n=1 Tax=Popillia japonica TaxID=7064 RepID=A0AAW1HRG1_POPJA
MDISIELCPTVNKDNWKREKAKKERYSRKRLPQAPKCKHYTKKFQCSSLTMADIGKFNEKFYAERNKRYQDMFVLKHCVIKNPVRKVIGNSKTMLTPETVKSFLWSEVDRRKSSNEIASAVFHTLSNHVFQDDVEIVRLMADGCAGQNKNCTVIGMMCYWLHCCAPTCIKRIEIVFPIVGHSFLPPTESSDILRKSRKILKMGKDYVVCDWKAASANVLKTPASWHFKLQKSKRIIISKTANGSVEVKGEPYYNSDVSVFSGICKRGKKIAQMKPKQLDVGRPVLQSNNGSVIYN